MNCVTTVVTGQIVIAQSAIEAVVAGSTVFSIFTCVSCQ